MIENRVVTTTCTRDCPDSCGMHARVTGGRLVALTGARGHEVTRNFLCRKSIQYIHRIYSPDRILKPLRKVDGRWQEMGWDEAFTIVAAMIKKTIDTYGNLAILHYQSAGSMGALKMLNKRFFNLLGGVTEATGSLCGGAAIAGQKMDFGYRTCHDPLDLLNSRLILLWGRNPSETNTHLIPILKDAQAKGARVVLIDPMITDTAKFCDMQVRPKPGADSYLALGMAKAILESGKADMAFVQDHTEHFGAFRDVVNRYDMAFLSDACGVPAEQIEQLASLYVERKPAAIVCGWGLQRYQWGAETFRLIDALAAVAGNLGIAGGGVNHGKDNDGYFDESVKGAQLATHKRAIPKPLLARGIAGADDPPIKMVIVNSANPVNQSPDAPAVAKALSGVDFVVVAEQFMTDTAELADVVLPVTTFLEETDVVASFWHNYIGPVNPAIQPRGEAKSDLEIYQGLAERLGFGDEMAGTPDEWLRRIIAPLKKRGITLEKLKEGHVRLSDAPMVAYERGAFGTETGKFQFISEFSAPQFGSEEYPLVLITPHTRRWVHSQVLPEEHLAPLTAHINPLTGADYGIGDGEAARVVSPNGSIQATVTYDEAAQPGVVVIEQGRWRKFNQSVNELTPAIMSNYGQNACYYQTTVRLER